MSLKSKLKRKVATYKEGFINTSIYKCCEEDIDDKIVYLESKDGKDFTGNIFRIAEELSTGKYGEYRIYVYANESTAEKIRKLQENYKLDIYSIITKEFKATCILQKAKYIFTDSGIRPKFIKRKGQILMNTWHGTPLKVMGFQNVPEQHRIGSIQHSFLDADYLLYPNDFMCEVMMRGYMIDKIYPGKVLLEGYPRNSVFLDEKRKDDFKSRLGIENKQVFVYMPTYRGTILERKDKDQKDRINNYLMDLDARLKDDQLLFVKLHVFNLSQINFSDFNHIQAFPQGYEVYDLLNMADVLITDYSSVFFDFAAGRRKIIIFNYDEAEYLADREVYFPISDLPFPKVQTVDDLVSELNSPINYDDSEFTEKFCGYERIDACEKICEEIFKGQNACRKFTVENKNPNIVIYVGSLMSDSCISSLARNLSNIDLTKVNVFLSFRQWDSNIKENHKSIFDRLPEGINILPFRGELNPTLSEKDDYNRIIANDFKGSYPSKLDSLFKRELKRYYHGISFDAAINFDGMDMAEILLFKYFKSKNALILRNPEISQELADEITSDYDIVVRAGQDDHVDISSVIRDLIF